MLRWHFCLLLLIDVISGIVYNDHITADTTKATLFADDSILSIDKSTQLWFQLDGNFVLYYLSMPIWDAKTTNKAINGKVRLQASDGNLVIRNATEHPQWDTKTHGMSSVGAPYHLVVITECAFLLDGGMNTLWSTATDGCTTNDLYTFPTISPSSDPTMNPSTSPSYNPTANPTINPSKNPSMSPSTDPSYNPSTNPSINPSKSPSRNPSQNPTYNPSENPSRHPTLYPSVSPSIELMHPGIEITMTNRVTGIEIKSSRANKIDLSVWIIGILSLTLLVVVLFIMIRIMLIACRVSKTEKIETNLTKANQDMELHAVHSTPHKEHTAGSEFVNEDLSEGTSSDEEGQGMTSLSSMIMNVEREDNKTKFKQTADTNGEKLNKTYKEYVKQ